MSLDVASRALTNDQWITGDDIKDPDLTRLRLRGLSVLVRPTGIRPKSKGGILLPDQYKESMAYLNTCGRVLAIGSLVPAESEVFKASPFKVGEYVCYGKNAGIKMEFQGVRLVLLDDDMVKLVVQDPTDLNPAFNLSN